ncbi:MAG: hypothetical protein AAFX90_10050 [Pseudomonadota bacterium]
MIKLTTAIKAALFMLFTLFLTACGDIATWSEERQQAAAEFALAEVQAANDEGFDPISIAADKLSLLRRGCRFIPVFYPEYADEAEKLCPVILEAAQ